MLVLASAHRRLVVACPCPGRVPCPQNDPVRWGLREVLGHLAGVGVDTAGAWTALERRRGPGRLDLASAVELLTTLPGANGHRADGHGADGHGERVAAWAGALAVAAGLPAREVEAVRWGAALHDLGKLRVPRVVLDKPGSLTPAERTLVQGHAVWGTDLLAPLPLPPATVTAVRHHHERWDGGGYPRGLRCRRIPLAARIVAVADVYDALVSARSYKPAWCGREAARVILREAGRQFDPRLARLFVREVLGFGDLTD